MARTSITARHNKASMQAAVPKAKKSGLTTSDARARAAKVSAAFQKKYADVRSKRPALAKGITVEDLMSFYFVPELKNALIGTGVSITAKKRVLAHRVAAWVNNGQKLRRANERYVPTGYVPKPRPKKGQGAAKKAAAPPVKRASSSLHTVDTPLSTMSTPRTKTTQRVSSGGAARLSFGAQSQTQAAAAQSYRHEHKWQYEDKSKANGPWHDYDVSGSDSVEDAYIDWKKDPHVDVRAVKSGEWEYMVDFNQMEQQNVKHTAHTRRKVRRVNVANNQIADAEGNEIRKRVQAQRAAAAGKR